ncbi:MAG: primosomal protein N' [Candidatus Niyogibacteria bacterium]|nr:primosomal protein N' [Candidatus Niyogibacteria bacterium]
MKLLTVIPIAKGVLVGQPLSYFAVQNIKPGSLVFVALRNKNIPALVTAVEDIKNKKAELKTAAFKLKKISGIISEPFLSEYFLSAANYVSDYYVSDLGRVLKQVIPVRILQKGGVAAKRAQTSSGKYFQPIVFQANADERVRYYKNIIRESFAKNESVFVCFPTIEEAKNAFIKLNQGIQHKSFILHSGLKISEFEKIYQEVARSKDPILLIGTGMHLFVDRPDLGTIIVDHEASANYKKIERPFLDIRFFAECLANCSQIRFIAGDLVPRIETEYAAINGLYQKMTVGSQHTTSRKMEFFPVNSRNTEFTAISKNVKDTIGQMLERNENVVLFVNRRGLSPITLCLDCGQAITCVKCSTPVVLHKTKDASRQFICHKCFVKLTLEDRCLHCGSWNLKSYGIGTEKVAEEAELYFPNSKIFQLNSDSIKSRKQGERVRDEFLKTPRGILIATELIFSYFHEPINNIIVVSIDNIFTLPDFRASERIFRMLLRLKCLSGNFFGIQSRLEDKKIFRDALNDNLASFYREELENRKQFDYPPSSRIIKLSSSAKSLVSLNSEVDKIKNLLKPFQPLDFPSFIHKIKNTYTHNIILKVPPSSWPYKNIALSEVLRNLGPRFTVQVDPISIF